MQARTSIRTAGIVGWSGAILISMAALAPAAAEQISFWTNLTTASQADVIKRQIDTCSAEQKDLTVDFETVPFNTMYARLITAMRNGSTPNIMNTIEGAVAFVQAKQGLVPVTGIVDGLGRDDFLPSYLNAVSKEGEVWGLPDWALHQEVWYRKDLFKAIGAEPPKSWPDLLALAAKLTKDTNGDGTPDTYGFAVPMGRALVAPQTYFQFFYAAGGTIFDPKTGDYVFTKNRDIAIKSLEFMIELYKKASPTLWIW